MFFINRLKKIKKLNNRYFALRHRESEINRQGIILSNPNLAVKGYGLTKRGKIQIKKSLSDNILDKETIIYGSDFLRAKETAQIAKQILRTTELYFNKNLREILW